MSDSPKITRPDDIGGRGFDKVFAFLRQRLLEGSLRPGDRLIPERELAVQLGVSRPILREALRALAVLGVVEIRDRVGAVVRRPDVSVLGDFFTFALAQRSDMVDDVMEARIAIECQAIRLACQRATLFDFERLRDALVRIEETINDPIAGGKADYEFHAALVRASKSETLIALYEAMSDLLMRSHLNRRELVRVFAATQPSLVEDHRRIFTALAQRDPEDADRVLRRHFAIGDEYRRRAAIDDDTPATPSN